MRNAIDDAGGVFLFAAKVAATAAFLAAFAWGFPLLVVIGGGQP